ncbi:MAG: prepilin-type N-terminal cleavage/methylation domain-containing protein [Lachnospiraceae bacterium]|nr:prepilin-type N-terminal cleavage/methylation domain-containing protein [Lachnospiraceae bacterium]
MKQNKGYTLVEVIIVIAIMAILSGMSFVTLGVIKQAKCNTAVQNLNDQIASLLVKTKAVSEAKDEKLCLLIRQNTAGAVTYADGTTAKKNTFSVILGTEDGVSFTEKEADTAEVTLTELVTIDYTPSDSAQLCPVSGVDQSSYMIIEFNKANGSVRYGAGDYKFIYNGLTIATVHLDAATGSHKVK